MLFAVFPSAWHLEEPWLKAAHPAGGTQAFQEFILWSAAPKYPELFHCFCWKQSLESWFNTMTNLKRERFYFYNLPPGYRQLLASLQKRFEIMPRELNRISYHHVHFRVTLCVKEIYRKCIAYYVHKNQLLQHLIASNVSLSNTRTGGLRPQVACLPTDLTLAICKGHFWSADKHIPLCNLWPLWWQFLMPGPHSSAPGYLIILSVAFDDLPVLFF